MGHRSLNNPSRRWRGKGKIFVAAFVLALAMAITTVTQVQRTQPSPQAALVRASNKFIPLQSFKTAAQGAGISKTPPATIKIGIEISNIYNLSLQDQTFMANGFYWLQWPKSVQQWMDEEEIKPEDLIGFTNNIVSYDFLVKPTTNKPDQVAGGAWEQTFQYSGHFWIESIDFKQFPFQTLQVPLRFEIKPEIFTLNGSKPVALVAEPQQPDLLGSLIEIPGLVLQGGTLEPYVHRFADDTSFATGTNPMSISQVKASAVFRTHQITSIGEWLIPILIVMLTVFVAPSINCRLSDMRIAAPSAALLTLVVMQQSFETAIPPLSYLTFLDLIYLWCYTITAGLFILFVWGANRFADAEATQGCDEAHLAAVSARVNRVDKRFQVASLVGSAVFLIAALLR